MQIKKITILFLLLLMALSACNNAAKTEEQVISATDTSTEIQQPTATQLPTETSTPEPTAVTYSGITKTMRLYFPNYLVANTLNAQIENFFKQNLEDFDFSGLDPNIHIEVNSLWSDFYNTADYAYIEVTVPEEEYTPEKALEMLFSYVLSDEEKQQGFFNELNGLEFVSLENVVDSDGTIASLSNEGFEDFQEKYGHDRASTGAEYVKIVLNDAQSSYWSSQDSDAFLSWQQEMNNADITDETVVNSELWTAMIESQIRTTVLQFYPNYELAAKQYSVDGSTNGVFYIVSKLAYSGCGSSTVCESLLDFNDYLVDYCYTMTEYGQDYFWCPVASADPGNWWKNEDPWLMNLQNLTGVCLEYPDTEVCLWPEVQETIK